MAERSGTHLVLIPSYNPGETVFETVRRAREQWDPVWVVTDGSTDGTPKRLQALAARDAGLRILVIEKNGGKGNAVLSGIRLAAKEGFTHVLTMDSDNQHPAELIPRFMSASQGHSRALVLGVPVFGANAPAIRVQGRKVSNWWANFETAGGGIGDSLYGFRVYPIADLVAVMEKQRWMRRFDFDPEAAVRLVWRGLVPVNVPAPVKYLTAAEGGVSHFRYGRDNVLLCWMHARLILEFLVRLPVLLWRRLRRLAP